ncbi:unnamed protein product [Amaranthus hypochondriacus]
MGRGRGRPRKQPQKRGHGSQSAQQWPASGSRLNVTGSGSIEQQGMASSQRAGPPSQQQVHRLLTPLATPVNARLVEVYHSDSSEVQSGTHSDGNGRISLAARALSQSTGSLNPAQLVPPQGSLLTPKPVKILMEDDGFQRVQRAKGKVPSQAPAAPSTALTRHTDLVASRNNFDVLDDIPKEHSEVPLVVSFGTINNAGDLPHQSNG